MPLHGFLDNLARCLPRPGTAVCRSSPRTRSSAGSDSGGSLVVRARAATPPTHFRTTRWRCDSPLCGPRAVRCSTLRTADRRRCLGCLPGVAAAPRCCIHRPLPDRDRHPDRHRCRRVASDRVAENRVDQLTYASPATKCTSPAAPGSSTSPQPSRSKGNRQRPGDQRLHLPDGDNLRWVPAALDPHAQCLAVTRHRLHT